MTPALHQITMLRITQEGDAGIVELNVSRSSLDQGRDFLPVGADQIGPESVNVRVVAFPDTLVAAAKEVDLVRRR